MQPYGLALGRELQEAAKVCRADFRCRICDVLLNTVTTGLSQSASCIALRTLLVYRAVDLNANPSLCPLARVP